MRNDDPKRIVSLFPVELESLERQYDRGESRGHETLRGVTSACRWCQIRQIGLCAALDDTELRDFEAIKSPRRLGDRQTLVVEGEPADYAFNVVCGGLKLVKSLADGRTQITGLLLAGDFLGIPPRGRYFTSAEALPGTELCQMPRRALEALFAKHRSLEMRMLTVMYDELAAAQEHMLLLGRKSARERLCSFLLGLALRGESGGGTVELLQLPLQRGEIADYLGLTLETVSRVFGQLHRDGTIRLVKADRVVIADRPELEEIAAGV